MSRDCLDCGEKIHQARLVVMPDADYCIDCVDNNSEPTIARMIYNHKTAGEIVVAKGKENVRLLNRGYNRSR